MSVPLTDILIYPCLIFILRTHLSSFSASAKLSCAERFCG